MRSPAPRSRRSGFTLIELLVVIAIIVLLATISTPAIISILQGQGITRATNDISGLLEQARSEAMSRNTWVWVGFADSKAATADNSDELAVVVVASLDGTSTLADTNYRRLLLPARLKNVGAALVGLSNVMPLAISLPGKTGTVAVSCQTVIAFSPQGEALLDTSSRTLPSWIELKLMQRRNGVDVPANTVKIKISGPSGQALILRN